MIMAMQAPPIVARPGKQGPKFSSPGVLQPRTERDRRAALSSPRTADNGKSGLLLLTEAIRGLMSEPDLSASEIALRSAQYEASALGQYCPEVAFDPTAVALRAFAARQRRSATRWARWCALVREALQVLAAPIELDALGRTCDALQVERRRSPHAEAADRRTLARAQELGLVCGPAELARYRASRFTELTATAYSEATAAVLQVANDWHFWLWSFDDRTDIPGRDLADDLDRHESVIAVLLDLLAGRDLPATPDAFDPSVRFLAAILADLQVAAPTACVDRFRVAVREYLVRGSLVGAHNWAAEHTPDPEAFLAQRIYEGAYDTILPFVELAAGCATADPVVTSESARRAALLANLIVVVSNDIFSFEKEVLHSKNPNNLLHALQMHERVDLRGSYLRAVALVEAWTAELLTLEANSSTELRAYIRGNCTWIAASYHWHFATGRYASPTSPFAELRRACKVTIAGQAEHKSSLAG